VSIRIHADQLARCSWVTDDEIYIDYHDTEWGVRTTGQTELFERLALEGFQAGLSWLTILKRRDGFRHAFAGFDPEVVAGFGDSQVESLMQNVGIIRNRAKILATISNAQIVVSQGLDLTELLWRFAPEVGQDSPEEFSWRATSPESDAMSKELKRLGFRFVGSTTMYALMQATGMIPDHHPNCHFKL
jgi:DNA-3-methyladenine glycosylase I